MENNCTCYQVLKTPREKIIIHLLGCEADYESKAYFKLKWYQRLFKRNPVRWYKYW